MSLNHSTGGEDPQIGATPMPLNPRASLYSNAREMMAAGHPRDQAFAAAYRIKQPQLKIKKPNLMASLRASIHLPRIGSSRRFR
jgi:hypothetical protein